MFGTLTEKLQEMLASLRGQKKLTDENIQEAIRKVRLALLDADVNFKVASDFIKRVKEKAIGEVLIKAVSPSDQLIKIVHDELVALMGGDEAELDIKHTPAIILLCGLQGAGKTTQCAKLAYMLKGKKFCRKPLLVACDLQRPAAIEQLQVLAQANHIDCYAQKDAVDPIKVARDALNVAKERGCDVIIFDTAGRLQIDEALMTQLKQLKEFLKPSETLFVASCAMGQDAVNTALEFEKQIGITGSILTMLDGSARAGAAISIRAVTARPLKFEGIGEKVEDLQVFNPISMADRILGMGDTINLVKKMQEHASEEENKKLEEKMLRAEFTFDDFLEQMQKMQKMGKFKNLIAMIPGADQIPNLENSEKDLVRMRAIIESMTPKERACRIEMEPSRRRRVAKGSGVDLQEVHKLIKNFKQLKMFAKELPKLKKQFGSMKSMDLDAMKRAFSQNFKGGF